MTFSNPVLSGFYPDPSLCRAGSDFFLVTSSFEYFPGVPVFHSRDLVHWEQIGHCLTRKSQLDLTGCPSSKGVYAPTLRYHGGTFYMVTTHMGRGYGAHFYVTARDPKGPWSEPVWVDHPHGIDPSLFFDDDGRVYFTSNGKADAPNGEGIYQSEIDIHTGQRKGEVRFLWTGTGGMAPEAPHLYKRNGRYYLVLAEGGTSYGHMVTLACADSPWGPFEAVNGNPILSHRSLGSPIHAVGHLDWVDLGDGSHWAVFLGIRPVSIAGQGAHHLGRETFLAPVSWDAAGLPVVNGGRPISLEMDGRGLPPYADRTQTSVSQVLVDDFDEPELGLHWNFLRGPWEFDFSLLERRSALRLYGTRANLSDLELAFIGQRQRHFDMTFQVELEHEPKEGEEAGITVRMNEHHHYSIFVTRVLNQKRVQVRKVVGSLTVTSEAVAIPTGAIVLQIGASRAEYTLEAFFSHGGGGNRGLRPSSAALRVKGETRLLSSEVAGTFTGVYLGLYAVAGADGSRPSPADFLWARYSGGASESPIR